MPIYKLRSDHLLTRMFPMDAVMEFHVHDAGMVTLEFMYDNQRMERWILEGRQMTPTTELSKDEARQMWKYLVSIGWMS
jgi:hypothetical protein